MSERAALPRKVLITGGAGFIGSHLCDYYIERGAKVECLDNFYTGSKRNIAHLQENPAFMLREHDVCEPFESENVDLVLHFACPASPHHYQKDAIYTQKICFLGTLNALEAAAKNKARIVIASTSEIYGDPLVHPQTEDYRGNVNPIGIRSCYDEGKRIGESLAFDFARQRQADIGIIRIFNTFGPRMDPMDGRVVSNLITQSLKSAVLTIYGNGEQTRSFCYVDDLVDGITRMAAKKGFEGPVNLGSDKEMTVMQLAEAVSKVTGVKAQIEHYPLPLDDPKVRRPDLTVARRELGYEAKCSLEDGIARTAAYFRELRNQESK